MLREVTSGKFSFNPFDSAHTQSSAPPAGSAPWQNAWKRRPKPKQNCCQLRATPPAPPPPAAKTKGKTNQQEGLSNQPWARWRRSCKSAADKPLAACQVGTMWFSGRWQYPRYTFKSRWRLAAKSFWSLAACLDSRLSSARRRFKFSISSWSSAWGQSHSKANMKIKEHTSQHWLGGLVG